MILCIGTTPTAQRSMLFDCVILDAVNRAAEVSEYASGKSINVARVLQTLGQSPLCTGFLGGLRGQMIRQNLDTLHIPHEFVTVSAPTRLCTTVIDRATQTATELVEESHPIDTPAWTELDVVIARLGASAKIWVLSGSLPPRADPHTYARWIKLAQQAGASVILDTRNDPARHALPLGGFTLKLNRDELATTLKTTIPDEPSLKNVMLQALPVNGVIVVTLGKDGSIGSNGEEFWHVRTPVIPVISPIGSGDAYAAGLAAGMNQSLPLPDCLKLAAACGAANAMTDQAGQIRQGDLDRILAQTVVSQA